jgi:ubiquinone biosynthesis protein UbiJ
MVNVLHSALASIAEKLINSYLALDPETPRLLEPLQGKTLKVEISDWSLSVLLAPNPKGFSVYINSENEAAGQISGRLFDVLEFAFSDHPQSLVSSGRVKQAGDIHVLQAYQAFIENSQVDWEGLLAKVIGDAAAFEICKTGKKAKAWHANACDSSCQDFAEFLQEEKRVIPPREEVEDFYEDIAKLREDVERLEARINKLN